MKNPQSTGISNITGKTVNIRHATEWDIIQLGGYLKQHRHQENDLIRSDVVVAAEEDRIIGFGILKKANSNDNSHCLTIMESDKHRGMGYPIVHHLLEYGSMGTVYVLGAKTGYFTKVGFTKKERPVRSLRDETSVACNWEKKGPSPAMFEKKRGRYVRGTA